MQFNLNTIKLIVGLGNIGKKFENTRHNVGFELVDLLCNSEFSNDPKLFSLIAKSTINSTQILFAKPTTLMNISGNAVSSITQYFKIKPDEIVVAYDDLDIKIGEYKIQFAKHPHDHNGVNSIIKSLRTDSFWNVRIGVDGRSPTERKFLKGRNYVLGKISADEREVIDKTLNEITNELTKSNELSAPSSKT